LLNQHGVSLTEAARFWLEKHNMPLIEATAEEIRDIWLNHRKRKMGYHPERSLRGRTLHFEKAFKGRKFGSITVRDLTDWQDGLLSADNNYTGRTVRNIHDSTKQLFKYARKRGYLESDRLSPMEIVERPKAEPGKKGIFAPEQMQSLLDAAWGMASPAAAAMAISAFTAIRSEELFSPDPDSTDEEQVNWE